MPLFVIHLPMWPYQIYPSFDWNKYFLVITYQSTEQRSCYVTFKLKDILSLRVTTLWCIKNDGETNTDNRKPVHKKCNFIYIILLYVFFIFPDIGFPRKTLFWLTAFISLLQKKNFINCVSLILEGRSCRTLDGAKSQTDWCRIYGGTNDIEHTLSLNISVSVSICLSTNTLWLFVCHHGEGWKMGPLEAAVRGSAL